ncbi:MAG: ABC transporter substrate-binding protein [Chloroflexi bacterium]|nr:ABC transporter substrate-binding protein [Chloroflexota bacterium]
MSGLWPTLLVAFMLAFSAIACAPAAPPSPTAAPLKPTEKPAATAAPAKPAEKPAAKPAATAAPAKPAEKPTEQPAIRPEDLKIPKPSGNLSLKVGHPSTISFYDVPTQITHERLKKDGWSIESVQFTRTDLNTQALAQGTVQVSIALSVDPLRVVEKGGKIKWLTENTPGEFVMIARKDIARCEDLSGKKFAIHGETSGTSLSAMKWIKDVCKASPTIIVVPGGENRIVALRNEQIDATLVQLADWLNLEAQAPGKFHVIVSGGPFNISGSGFWVNVDWLEKNRELATAYVAETLKTYRMIYATPKLLEDVVVKYVPDTKPEVVPATVKAYLGIGAWPRNGGDTSMLKETIQFFTERDELKPGMEASKLVESSVLENALKIVGKVAGVR